MNLFGEFSPLCDMRYRLNYLGSTLLNDRLKLGCTKESMFYKFGSRTISTAQIVQSVTHVTQRAKFAEKVHKPPLWVNVINFELNWLDASIWVPWSPSDSKKL